MSGGIFFVFGVSILGWIFFGVAGRVVGRKTQQHEQSRERKFWLFITIFHFFSFFFFFSFIVVDMVGNGEKKRKWFFKSSKTRQSRSRSFPLYLQTKGVVLGAPCFDKIAQSHHEDNVYYFVSLRQNHPDLLYDSLRLHNRRYTNDVDFY